MVIVSPIDLARAFPTNRGSGSAMGACMVSVPMINKSPFLLDFNTSIFKKEKIKLAGYDEYIDFRRRRHLNQGFKNLCCIEALKPWMDSGGEVKQHALDLFGSELLWKVFLLGGVLSFHAVIRFSQLVAAKCVMCPILWCLWGVLCAPFHLILGISNFVGFVYKYMYDLVVAIWLFVSSILKVASSAEATVHSYEVSMWRALWNDLFSQIFRATKSILYGVVAFFAACNRHRLSIYNHLREFIRRHYQPAQRSELLNSNNRVHKSGTRTPEDDVNKMLISESKTLAMSL